MSTSNIHRIAASSTLPKPRRKPRDVFFTPAMHLRLLMRVDRTFNIEKALRRVIRPGARVLDAGCGSGLLSFLALEAGASEVVAVDRDNIALAEALAHANGVDRKIRFVEADLNTLEAGDVGGRFDTLIAFIYTNHIIIDEARSRMAGALRRKFGAPGCTMVPNKVRYRAIPCDAPQRDAFTELADLKQSVAELESRYGLKLGPLLEEVAAEIHFDHSRPSIHGEYEWSPSASVGGYRHKRGGWRILGEPTLVTEIAYEDGAPFERLPERCSFEIRSPGTFAAVMWVQELLLDDLLIWHTEAFSPVVTPLHLPAGARIDALLDESWRASNCVALAPSVG